MAASVCEIGVILMVPLDIHLLPIFCMAASDAESFLELGSK
jgi:hypothetical protein